MILIFELCLKKVFLKYQIVNLMVRMKGLEPSRLAAPDPKSGVYTNFTTSACDCVIRTEL